jgi:predicted  nucleic acid-binding Zn-ribbon protein
MQECLAINSSDFKQLESKVTNTNKNLSNTDKLLRRSIDKSITIENDVKLLSVKVDNLSNSFENFKEETNEKFSNLDNRMENLEGRMDGLENRMENLEGRMDGLENRMDNLETKVDNIQTDMKEGFAKIDDRFDKLFDFLSGAKSNVTQ